MAKVKTKRRRILVVGGKPLDIPRAFARKFEIEQLPQDASNSRVPDWLPKRAPDLIAVLFDYGSHAHVIRARELGAKYNVLAIESPSGFSILRQRLLDQGVTWVEEELASAHDLVPLVAERDVEASAWEDLAVKQGADLVALERKIEELEVTAECTAEANAVALQLAADLNAMPSEARFIADEEVRQARLDACANLASHRDSIRREHTLAKTNLKRLATALESLEEQLAQLA